MVGRATEGEASGTGVVGQATELRVSSQDRRRLQDVSIVKMCLLITNLSKSIYQGDIRVMSKQLGPKRLKLIRKLSQEVISVTKLKCSLLIHT
jgi:hypothetical protein